MDNVGKSWDNIEEEQLVKEINKLIDIDKICNNHKRQIGGIRARIKKIIEDPNLSDKLIDKTQIVVKYFSQEQNNTLSKEDFVKYKKLITSNLFNFSNINDISEELDIKKEIVLIIFNSILKKEQDDNIIKKINKLIKNEKNINTVEINNNSVNKKNINKEETNENEIINNIKEFSSVFMIKKVYSELDINEIILILKNYIKSENCEIKKKDQIKSILKKYKMCKEEDTDDENFDINKYKNKCKIISLKNNINNKTDKIDKIINNYGDNDNKELQKIFEFLKELKYEISDIKNEIFELNIKINNVLENKYDSTNKKINTIKKKIDNNNIFLSPNEYKELSDDFKISKKIIKKSNKYIKHDFNTTDYDLENDLNNLENNNNFNNNFNDDLDDDDLEKEFNCLVKKN